MLLACVLALCALSEIERETITFPSGDKLEITADVYRGDGEGRPLIVLFHQAGWSRGEYREIAPRLVELGYDCMAVDLRSGKAVAEVENETAKRAKAAELGTQYADAEQDVVAALERARERVGKGGRVIAWGSSYSAALVLRVGGERPELGDGWLAFAPGEYFHERSKTWVRDAARKIAKPVFATSAKEEAEAWRGIWDALPHDVRTRYLPQTQGNHGSRALWKQFDDSQGYWTAVETFLAKHFPTGKRG